MSHFHLLIFKNIDIFPVRTLKVYTDSHPDGPDAVSTHKLHHIYNQHDTVELICVCGNVISTCQLLTTEVASMDIN